VDIRPTLLRVLTDLFVQRPRPSASEVAQFVELASHLVESVDAPTRAAVAVRLMSHPHAPQALLDRLQALTGYTVSPPIERPAEPAPTSNNELSELFLRAGSDERRMILANLDIASATGAALLTPQAAVDCLALEAAVLANNTEAFVQTLARALNVPQHLAE